MPLLTVEEDVRVKECSAFTISKAYRLSSLLRELRTTILRERWWPIVVSLLHCVPFPVLSSTTPPLIFNFNVSVVKGSRNPV